MFCNSMNEEYGFVIENLGAIEALERHHFAGDVVRGHVGLRRVVVSFLIMVV